MQDTIAGYYTNLSELFLQDSTITDINVFGVIISFIAPKSCRGTHKYCMSFCIIDPSIESPPKSVSLNWFCNTMEGFQMNYRVGDILRCEKVKMQKYNNLPQLTGKSDSSTMTVFHKNEHFLTGLHLGGITSSPTLNTDLSIKNHMSRKPFTDPFWKISMQGPTTTKKGGRSSLSDKQTVRQCDAMLWNEEVCKLKHFEIWTRKLLSNTSLAEMNRYHITLHNLQRLLYSTANSTEYDSLKPAVDTNNYDQGSLPSSTNYSSLGADRYDIVCLVLRVIKPPDSVANNNNNSGLASLIVWDGTTNGFYEILNPLNARVIDLALSSPAAHCRVTADGANTMRTDDDIDISVAATDAAVQKELQPMMIAAGLMNATATTTAITTTTNSSVVADNSDSSSKTATRYMGSAVCIKAADASMNLHILRCLPGMWIRIRNLHAAVIRKAATTTSSQPQLDVTVHPDTHICALSPYFKDVKLIASNYFQRLAQNFLMQQQKLRDSQLLTKGTTATPTVSTVTTATTAAAVNTVSSLHPPLPPPPQPIRLATTTVDGDSITSLALVCAGPAPAKYCTLAHIVDWWPKDINRFIVRQDNILLKPSSVPRNNNDENQTSSFLFAIKITDTTEVVSVLFSGEEAERFLGGITAASFEASAEVRSQVERMLQYCKVNYHKMIMPFKFRVYFTMTTTNNNNNSHNNNNSGGGGISRATALSTNAKIPSSPIAHQAKSAKKTKGNDGCAINSGHAITANSNSDDNVTRKLKRLLGFNTICKVEE